MEATMTQLPGDERAPWDGTEDAAPEGDGALRVLGIWPDYRDELAKDMAALRIGLTAAREHWSWIARDLREVKHEIDRYGRHIVRIRFRLVNEDEMWTQGFTIEQAVETAQTYQRTAERVAFRLDRAL